MPCNLGYKSFDRVTIATSQPLTMKKQTAAPKVDAALMERIGQDDPAFVDWMNEMDTGPLLEQALKRTLAASGGTSPVTFAIDGGNLTATATYRSAADKNRVEKISDRVAKRWQAEVLAVVAQLLDFETQITVDGEVVRVEGEKHGSSQVHEYLRVTLDPANGASVMFEHFATAKERDLMRSKFLGLAQKLGIKLTVTQTTKNGSPIPVGAVHKHFIKSGK